VFLVPIHQGFDRMAASKRDVDEALSPLGEAEPGE